VIGNRQNDGAGRINADDVNYAGIIYGHA
jgi:hypothetical protein